MNFILLLYTATAGLMFNADARRIVRQNQIGDNSAGIASRYGFGQGFNQDIWSQGNWFQGTQGPWNQINGLNLGNFNQGFLGPWNQVNGQNSGNWNQGNQNQGNWNQQGDEDDWNQADLNEEGKPIWNQRPRQEINGNQGNNGNFGQTTQRPFTQPPTTVASTSPPTTLTPDVLRCVDQCGTQTTGEYNPICGTDNITYHNIARFLCAQDCGSNVQRMRFGRCPRI